MPTAIKWVVAIQVGAPELTRSIAEQICDETAFRITCLGEIKTLKLEEVAGGKQPHDAPKLLSCVV